MTDIEVGVPRMFRRQDWVFRVSISNGKIIMIFAANSKLPNSFMARFFVDVDVARCWVEEVQEGRALN